MRSWGSLLGVFACLGLSAGAFGQDNADRAFQSIWIIQPNDQPTGPRSVRDGELVFRNRLLPPMLARLTADAVDRDSGEVVAPAGTQLFGLMTRGAPIYCVVGRRDPSTAVRILLAAANRQICLIDTNRDSVFDAHFRVTNNVMGVPNIQGRRPRNPDALTGGAFETLAPDEIATDYYVGVKFEGIVGLLTMPQPTFSIVFGTEESSNRLTMDVRPVRRSNPPVVTPLGAEFVVSAINGDVIEIDVRRNIPPQPFGVVRTTTYRFY